MIKCHCWTTTASIILKKKTKKKTYCYSGLLQHWRVFLTVLGRTKFLPAHEWTACFERVPPPCMIVPANSNSWWRRRCRCHTWKSQFSTAVDDVTHSVSMETDADDAWNTYTWIYCYRGTSTQSASIRVDEQCHQRLHIPSSIAALLNLQFDVFQTLSFQ